MDETSDEVTFTPETVEPICYKAIKAVLKDKIYNPINVTPWVDEICSRVTKDLIDMNKPFKYLVSCMIMQKNGAGVHMGHSCFWDRTNDNVVVQRWPSERRKDPNARMVCIVTVFGMAF
jgi:dynein light chain Tctex-type 1